MEFERLNLGDEEKINRMSGVATEIIRKYYDPLLGTAQNDYMLEMFQSPRAITEQLEHGYEYYFIIESGRCIGFTAFYPREDHMYVSKLYLYEDERGKGYSRGILVFITGEAKKQGLSAIELNANKYNPSCKAYEKLGFRIIRAEKNDIGSGYYMDDYVFRLEF